MYISYEFIFGYCKLWPTGISVFFRFLIHLIALKVHNWRNVIFNIVPKEIFVVVENFYQMDINKFQTGFRFCLCLWLNECYMIVSSILERLKRWTFRNISTVSILNDPRIYVYEIYQFYEFINAVNEDHRSIKLDTKNNICIIIPSMFTCAKISNNLFE